VTPPPGAGPPAAALADDLVAGYRAVMSAFPTGVAVVTSTDRAGQPRGLTCNSLTSVTLTPPTLLVCIHTGSPTLAAIRDRGAFAVNLLHARARYAATIFASHDADRFAEIRWRAAPETGLPWLHADAFALAECRLAGATQVGDHLVVLGEVIAAHRYPGTPLLYGLRHFTGWPTAP
jgi:flavin reductase (DIM6/NTAB) family NADH-FMN oxidoreductase RutF